MGFAASDSPVPVSVMDGLVHARRARKSAKAPAKIRSGGRM